MTSKRRTIGERVVAALTGRRAPQVLVLVNTTRGPRAVPVPLKTVR